MEITVKQNLIIFHRDNEWKQIINRLAQDFGPSIRISWRMKKELGFTVRAHTGWQEVSQTQLIPGRPRYYPVEQIHLDFFDSRAQSWFLLRYCGQQIPVDQ